MNGDITSGIDPPDDSSDGTASESEQFSDVHEPRTPLLILQWWMSRICCWLWWCIPLTSRTGTRSGWSWPD